MGSASDTCWTRAQACQWWHGEALSTALFVMGPEEGSNWMAGRRTAGAVFLIDGREETTLRVAGSLAPVARVLEVLAR